MSRFNRYIALPLEMQLLIEMVKDTEEIEGKINIKDIDWDEFYQFMMHHRLFPAVHKYVNKYEVKWIPKQIKDRVSYLYNKNTFKMMQLCAEMGQVSKMFSENSVDILFLKGPILSKHLYGNLSLRTSSDIDLLIELEQLDVAEQLLVENGYVKDDYIETVLNDWKWRHHHVSYYHPEKQVKIEIHWRLHPGPGKEPSFMELWAGKRKSDITTQPVYFLGEEHLVYYLITHGVRHGWSRLRWLLDIDQIYSKQINDVFLYQLFKDYSQPSLLKQVEFLLEELLEKDIRKIKIDNKYGKLGKKLAKKTLYYFENRINLHSNPVPTDVSDYHSHYLFNTLSFKQKFSFFANFAYPFPIDAKTLPLPKKFHVLYFPLRPFLCFWRKVRKTAFS